MGRRTKKVVTNSGDLDRTEVYYFDGQKIIETHDGSANVVQQFIHGTQYIDELVMMRRKDKGDVYVHQDANWNVIALTDLGGSVVERYVYTPYGEVTVHQNTSWGDYDGDGDVDSADKAAMLASPPGICRGSSPAGACRLLDLDFDNDVDSTDETKFDALTAGTARHPGLTSTGVEQPMAHQGLPFEPEIGGHDSRRRKYAPSVRRFLQRDRAGYADSLSLYGGYRANPISVVDPFGNVGVSMTVEADQITISASVAFWGCGLNGTCGNQDDDAFCSQGPSLCVKNGVMSFATDTWNSTKYSVWLEGRRRLVKFALTPRHIGSFRAYGVDCPEGATTHWGGVCAVHVIDEMNADISVWVKPTGVGGEVDEGGGRADVGGDPGPGTEYYVRAVASWSFDEDLKLIAHEVGHLLAGIGHPSDGCACGIMMGARLGYTRPIPNCNEAAQAVNYQISRREAIPLLWMRQPASCSAPPVRSRNGR